MQEPQSKAAKVGYFVFGLLVLLTPISLVIWLVSLGRNAPDRTGQKPCISADGNIYSDVQLFSDPNCQQSVGYIIGGNDEFVLVGVGKDQQWKRRTAIRNQAYVKTSDPRLPGKQWKEFSRPAQ